MNTKLLFMPKKIKVGYQKDNWTYSGKLAYVIYYDEDGKLRKEKSWEQWRNKGIPADEFDNVPMEGFVLNKKAGGTKSGWNFRQTYTRVYDPRGFEFEITIENLLYILENCDCYKGKGLEGKFVYTWDEKSLVLLPVNAPEYQQIVEYNNMLNNKVKITNKTLKLGHMYTTKKNEEYIYVGKSHNGNQIFARYKYSKEYFELESMKSCNGKFVKESAEPVDNAQEILDKMQFSHFFSPIAREEFVPLTLKQFIKKNGHMKVFFKKDGKMYRVYSFGYWSFNTSILDEKNTIKYYDYEECSNDYYDYNADKETEELSIREFFDKYETLAIMKYLENGNLYYDGIENEHTCR